MTETLRGAPAMVDHEAVIGLEVHAQLLTRSKMFCGCPAGYVGAAPNENTCPVCLGLPGTLPVINRRAVEHTVRAALHCIGVRPGFKLVSSFFLMALRDQSVGSNGAMIFADCGVVIEPSAAELAEIAIASADSCRALLGAEPRVAMLSFSTKGSASHRLIDKVVEATRTVRARAPEIEIDGELQAVPPTVLVCLGATAAQALLGRQFRVTKQRGTWIESDLAELVTATIHPSAILRQRTDEDRQRETAAFVEDLRLVATVLS